jgi:hypothetical protein
MLLFLTVMVVFRLTDHVSGSDFSSALATAITAFFGSNVGEHLVNLGRQWVQGKLNRGEVLERLEK